VQHLLDVVRGRHRIEVWPQGGRDLIAVQAVARGQGQQLDQRLGLAQAPGGLFNRPATGGDPAAPEEFYPQHPTPTRPPYRP